MKRLTLVLSMLIALVGLNANAAIYIVGDGPLGGWAYDGGIEMFDSGNGVYTHTMTIAEDAENTIVYFVFADGRGADWGEFNGTMRIGPTNGNIKIEDANWVETQKAGGDNGAYYFMGIQGESYTVTYDSSNSKFKVEGAFEQPPVGGDTYTVAGSSADLFGTTWAPANADNDMKLVDGLYTWTKENVELTEGSFEFKVVVNHSWGEAYPSSNYVQPVENGGTYNVKITFNAETKEVKCELTPVDVVVRGDVDGDMNVNISDVTALIDYLLSGQTAPAAADCDQDGNVNISDVTCLIDFLLSGNWPAPAITVYTVAGDESVFGSSWDPTDTKNDMKLVDGLYTLTKENVTLTGSFKFKVVGNHAWSAYEWPIGEGNDYVVNVAEEGIYTIVITFNPDAEEADRITCTLTKTGDIAPVEHTYTVAGAPGSLFGAEWAADHEGNDMVKGDDGKYTWKYEGYVATGAVEVAFKVVQDHNWSNAWPASNYETLIGSEYDPMTVYIVTITFDPETKEIGFGALPVQNPE